MHVAVKIYKTKKEPMNKRPSIINMESLLYCLFGLNQIIDFRTRFSTTKYFGSKRIARVSHVEFISLWSDEAKN